MKYGNVYVSYTEDCGENIGGYYCQVYSDESMENQIDNFYIHPNDCDCTNEKEVEAFIKEYVRQYEELAEYLDSIE